MPVHLELPLESFPFGRPKTFFARGSPVAIWLPLSGSNSRTKYALRRRCPKSPEISLQHSGATGEVRLEDIDGGGLRGFGIVVQDSGCGIADLGRALGDGESSLVLARGAGLPGSKSLMGRIRCDHGSGPGDDCAHGEMASPRAGVWSLTIRGDTKWRTVHRIY